MNTKRFHRYRTLVAIYTMVACLLVMLVPSQIVTAAGPNKLYVTPASSQMNIGTSFTVNIRSYADTDQAVGSVNGTLTYPAGLLRVTGISVSGSGYGSPTISQGSGTVGFSGTRNPAPGGSAQIFAVTFQATGSGIATVGFSGNSLVNNATTQYTNGAYTITNPNPPPSTKPSTAPKPSKAPVVKPVPIVATPVETPPPASLGPVEPQPTPDPTGVIDSVNVNPLHSTSTVSWKVNAGNPQSTLSYGTSSSKMDKTAEIKNLGSGSFSASITGLNPGVRYYFIINATGSESKSGTYSGTLITRGYPISMTITENNIPVKSGQVKLGDRSYPISSDGKLGIGLAAGSYSGTITTDTASLTINLTVEAKPVPSDGTAPAIQTFGPFKLTSSPLEQGPGSNFSILGFIGVLLGGTAVLAIGFVGFMAYRRRKFEGGSSSNIPASTVVIEDGYDWHEQTTTTSQDAPVVENAPPPPPTVPKPYQPVSQHNNSVYLTEEEPLDMFDQAPKYPLPPTSQPAPTSIVPPAPGQNPNLPHSTTP